MEEIKKIAEFNGKKGIIDKFKEESSELDHELYLGTKETVIDELADVKIVIEQIIELWGIDFEELEERMFFKANRTIERLNNGTLKRA